VRISIIARRSEALTIVYRNLGAEGGVSASPLRSLLTMRQITRARVLGAAMCIAYYLSASTPGVLWHWCLVVN
jgi:exopolyphosphatase/guanosine-5'-triphosphate,3'-diphosphate pyrophosphatase